ncbi:MAG: acyl carrier protein [Anaerolineae bacterium]|nr:acyl carrier protein [Anaerolineae bacterium]
MLTQAEIREKVRQFILTEFVHDQSYPLTDDEGIITGGFMDSLALVTLGVYIEDEFGVEIPDPELTVAKMDTLDLIVARILRL